MTRVHCPQSSITLVFDQKPGRQKDDKQGTHCLFRSWMGYTVSTYMLLQAYRVPEMYQLECTFDNAMCACLACECTGSCCSEEAVPGL